METVEQLMKAALDVELPPATALTLLDSPENDEGSTDSNGKAK